MRTRPQAATEGASRSSPDRIIASSSSTPTVRDSIVGPGAVIGADAVVEAGTVLGDGAVVEPGEILSDARRPEAAS